MTTISENSRHHVYSWVLATVELLPPLIDVDKHNQ